MEMSFDTQQSILNTVKKVCGISDDYTAFDQDILVFINSAMLDLIQNGVGREGYVVTDVTDTWNDYLSDFSNPGAVAGYISQKVRLMFDPPTSSFVVESIQKRLDELIWRLNLEADK